MKIVLLSNEYPPHIYGGAGVHIDHLSREMARLAPEARFDIFCFGDQESAWGNLAVTGIAPPCELPAWDPRHRKLLDALARNLVMSGSIREADLIHCHTWYSHFAGCLLKAMLGAPLVLTTHSLEPHRPWKEEQLGRAYHATTWLEKTAYQNADGIVAVSRAMKRDVCALYGIPPEKVRVIHNGIDAEHFRPRFDPALLRSHGIDPDRPFVLFVGRITRQKGILHLVNAIAYIQPGVQIVLCAGAPDTETMAGQMEAKVARVRTETRNPVIWISEILPEDHLVVLYSHASIFVCPSVYEPFGIINLEAMACRTPVVASAVGGIPEVVAEGETGLLAPFEPSEADAFEPADPEAFARNLAEAVNRLLASPDELQKMGGKARERVEAQFTWKAVAARTLEYYGEILSSSG